MQETIPSSKTQILDAAANCFMNLGSDVASIDDIARSIGATKGRIYHHYPSKGSLLSAVRMRAVAFTLDALATTVGVHKAPADKLRLMAYTHVLTVIKTLPYHKVVLQHYRENVAKSTTEYERKLIAEIEDRRRTYENLFREVIDQGIKNGAFADRDSSVSLHSVLILLNSPVFWYTPPKTGVEQNRQAIANQLADMALASLGVETI
ncbi:MAG: TetR/AcrR family transcriptional regulator [Rhizobiales bacterium]|nr:TetR/AcrR family transcriptional regulator [Hyphomicrobiales bacterium]NRB13293.1 TetR/AcrR family transcriptional regulator [Hyphomicrobiales bacterium]